MNIEMDEDLIDTLVAELEDFHARNPMSDAFSKLYQRAPVEKMVRNFLVSFMDKGQAVASAHDLAASAIEAGLPYTVLMGDINFLQNAIVRLPEYSESDSIEAFIETGIAFADVRTEVARHYFHHLLRQNSLLRDSGGLIEKPLLTMYENWFSMLREVLLANDLDRVGELAEQHFRFSDALQYPESQMVCIDEHSCAQLNEYHQLVRKQTALLFFKLAESAYEEAIIIYNELVAQTRRIVALLTTLYFNYGTNRLGIFFRYLAQQSEVADRQYLACIEINNCEKPAYVRKQHAACLTDVLNHCLDERRAWAAAVTTPDGAHLVLIQTDDENRVTELFDEISGRFLECADDNQNHDCEISCSAVYVPLIGMLDDMTIERIIRFLRQFDDEQKSSSSRYMIFSSSGQVNMVNQWVRASIADALDIESMLDEQQIELLLQPVRENDEVVGHEVFGRFSSAGHRVSAGALIERMRHEGRIDKYDMMIMRLLSENADKLRKISDRIFVNMSIETLLHDEHVERISEILGKYLKNMSVILEVEESEAMAHASLLMTLHDKFGFVFAIDDFASVPTDLEHIVRLVDRGVVGWLKISGRLTTRLETEDPSASRIFDIVTRINQSLKTRIIAKSVETETVAERLRSMGLHLLQGFRLGKPDTLAAWLVKQALLDERPSEV